MALKYLIAIILVGAVVGKPDADAKADADPEAALVAHHGSLYRSTPKPPAYGYTPSYHPTTYGPNYHSVTPAYHHVTPAYPAVTPGYAVKPAYPSVTNGYPVVTPGYPAVTPGYPAVTPGYPAVTPGYPAVTPGYPAVTPGYPAVTPGYPAVTPGYPAVTPGYPAVTPGYPAVTPGYPAVTPGYPAVTPGYPAVTPGYHSVTPGYPVVSPGYAAATPSYPVYPSQTYPSHHAPAYPSHNHPTHDHGYKCHGYDKVPKCSYNTTKTWCLHDPEYPEYEIKDAIHYHKENVLSLYADVADLSTANSVYRPRYLQEETYLCPSDTSYVRPLRAINTDGVWRIIINNVKIDYETFTQTTRIEECLSYGPCPLVPHCHESKCLQKSIYHRFLVYDPCDKYFPFAIETFRLPSTCACLLGSYFLGQ